MNLPMRGIVHVGPGRPFFLARYDACSKTKTVAMMARMVKMVVVRDASLRDGRER